MPLSALKPEHDGKAAIVGGAIADMREITTKNGQKMAFVKVEDQFGEVELILFPNAYQQTAGLWERDRVILCRGKISAKNREGNIGEELKVLVDDAREITAEQAQAYQATGKRVKLPGEKRNAAAVAGVRGKAVTAASPASVSKIPKRLYVRLSDSNDQSLLVSLKQCIDANAGSTEVVLVLGPADSKQVIKLPLKINTDEPAIAKLRDLVGHSNVKLQ
jgi:DNA polymerase III subunit alpha